METTAASGKNGVSEVLRRGVIEKLASDLQLMQEVKIMEKFEEQLILDSSKVTYGLDEVEQACSIGAAEEIFRSVETNLTALLYNEGIVDIEYPRYGEDSLTGRSALQRLIRDYLIQREIITNEEYQTYRNLVSELHERGYIPGEDFDKNELTEYAEYAENLLVKARAVLPDSS